MSQMPVFSGLSNLYPAFGTVVHNSGSPAPTNSQPTSKPATKSVSSQPKKRDPGQLYALRRNYQRLIQEGNTHEQAVSILQTNMMKGGILPAEALLAINEAITGAATAPPAVALVGPPAPLSNAGFGSQNEGTTPGTPAAPLTPTTPPAPISQKPATKKLDSYDGTPATAPDHQTNSQQLINVLGTALLHSSGVKPKKGQIPTISFGN